MRRWRFPMSSWWWGGEERRGGGGGRETSTPLLDALPLPTPQGLGGRLDRRRHGSPLGLCSSHST